MAIIPYVIKGEGVDTRELGKEIETKFRNAYIIDSGRTLCVKINKAIDKENRGAKLKFPSVCFEWIVKNHNRKLENKQIEEQKRLEIMRAEQQPWYQEEKLVNIVRKEYGLEKKNNKTISSESGTEMANRAVHRFLENMSLLRGEELKKLLELRKYLAVGIVYIARDIPDVNARLSIIKELRKIVHWKVCVKLNSKELEDNEKLEVDSIILKMSDKVKNKQGRYKLQSIFMKMKTKAQIYAVSHIKDKKLSEEAKRVMVGALRNSNKEELFNTFLDVIINSEDERTRTIAARAFERIVKNAEIQDDGTIVRDKDACN